MSYSSMLLIVNARRRKSTCIDLYLSVLGKFQPLRSVCGRLLYTTLHTTLHTLQTTLHTLHTTEQVHLTKVQPKFCEAAKCQRSSKCRPHWGTTHWFLTAKQNFVHCALKTIINSMGRLVGVEETLLWGQPFRDWRPSTYRSPGQSLTPKFRKEKEIHTIIWQ